MDFGDISNGCSASSSFDDADRFCQDTQHRHRKSPRERLRAPRTSALVIDQLKSSFQLAGDFASRMRARRNWRPEFLIRYLGDNRHGDNEVCAAVIRGKSRSFVPETPRIYSIGLRCGAKKTTDFDDYSSWCSVLRKFQRRLRSLDLRANSVVTCELLVAASKHWFAQPTSGLTTAVFLEKRAKQQTRVVDWLKSADVPKLDWTPKSSRCDDRSYERIEEKVDAPSTLQSDRSFAPDLRSVVEKSNDGHLVSKKDAQVQTSSKKSSRRKNTTRKSTSEKVLPREHEKPTFTSSIADFRLNSFGCSGRASRDEELLSRLSIRFLEGKRAEYINKFTAVKRQIEEITATLRETCYSERSSRGDPENCEETCLEETCVNSKQVQVDGEENDHTVLTCKKGGSTVEEDELDGGSVDDLENAGRNLDVDSVNDFEPPVSSDRKQPRNTIIVSATNLCGGPSADDAFVRDCIRTFTIKEMLHPSNGTPGIFHRRRAMCRLVKQISLDLTKDDDEPRRLSDEDSDEICPSDNFAAADDDVLIEDMSSLAGPRYRKLIVDEKVGEMAVLNGIKKRIDRDFDDRAIGRDTEDLPTVSQGSIHLENDAQLYRSTASSDVTSTTIVESPAARLVPTETQIRDSTWADATSELSNRNSTFSIYHSCSQFPSFVSLREDEDELEAEDRSAIGDDSCSNSHSNCCGPDYSRVSGNGYSPQSNFNFDQPDDDDDGQQRIVQHEMSTSPSVVFLSETIDGSDGASCDMLEERIAASQAHDCGHFPSESNETEEESRVHPEEQYAADSTFETSKSSRYIGSIDSGVFVNSSLADLQSHEYSSSGRPDHRKQRRVKERDLRGPTRTFDFSSDNSSSSCCTDDTLDRRINGVIRDLTKNLVLCERRVRMKLREMRKTGSRTKDARYWRYSPPRACKLNDFGAYDFFKSPGKDERISGISTPSFVSLPESEIEDHESTC